MTVASCHPEKQCYGASLKGLGLPLTSLRGFASCGWRLLLCHSMWLMKERWGY